MAKTEHKWLVHRKAEKVGAVTHKRVDVKWCENLWKSFFSSFFSSEN